MVESQRRIVIAGNWKMYKTIEESVQFIKELKDFLDEPLLCEIYLAVPFTGIRSVSEEARGSPIVIGAQNMNDVTEGAFTGEVAGRMLKEAGATFVIIGHSERRHIFNESNALINRKLQRALSDDLEPILCIGETLQERKEGKTEEVIENQLIESFKGLESEQVKKCLLAYEPVWAIGTGETATPEQAQETQQFCRDLIKKEWGKEVAEHLVIQYGGSVKPDNAAALMAQPDIDGLLIGGASLSVKSFNEIIHYK